VPGNDCDHRELDRGLKNENGGTWRMRSDWKL